MLCFIFFVEISHYGRSLSFTLSVFCFAVQGQSPASGLVSAGSLSLNSIYGKMWLGLTALDRDPHPDVAALSRTVTDHIRNKVPVLVSIYFYGFGNYFAVVRRSRIAP